MQHMLFPILKHFFKYLLFFQITLSPLKKSLLQYFLQTSSFRLISSFYSNKPLKPCHSLVLLMMTTLLPQALKSLKMKTCAIKCHTWPWSDASKASSKTIFKSLQKWELGGHVNRQLVVLSLDYTF